MKTEDRTSMTQKTENTEKIEKTGQSEQTPEIVQPQRVMAIYAHPDDPEFFSGGTLIKWGLEGRELVYVLATSGDAGSDDPDMTRERLIEIRESEQRAAAR